MAQPAWIEIGYVVKPRGLRGGLRVRLHNAGSDILDGVETLSLKGPGDEPRRSFGITGVSSFGEFCEVHLEGVTDRTGAEALAGATVWLSRDQLPELEADEYYHFQLIGLKVVDESGRPLGRLEEIYTTPANDIYVVRGGAVGELLVPAIGTYIHAVDLEAGTLTLAQVDALLEE